MLITDCPTGTKLRRDKIQQCEFLLSHSIEGMDFIASAFSSTYPCSRDTLMALAGGGILRARRPSAWFQLLSNYIRAGDKVGRRRIRLSPTSFAPRLLGNSGQQLD